MQNPLKKLLVIKKTSSWLPPWLDGQKMLFAVRVSSLYVFYCLSFCYAPKRPSPLFLYIHTLQKHLLIIKFEL